MIDILVFLFENYFDLGAHPAPEALVRKLSAVGFDPDEISEALAWLQALKSAHPVDFPSGAGSTRIYTNEEYGRLGRDGVALLAFLEFAGVVSPSLRELIVDRAMALADDPLSLEKLKIIVLMVLWGREQDLEPLIVEELLTPLDDALLH